MRLTLPVLTTCALCAVGLVWCASFEEKSKQQRPAKSPQQVQQVRQPSGASNATGIAAVATPTRSTNGVQEPTRAAATNPDGGLSEAEALYNRGLDWFSSQSVDPQWAPAAEAAVDRSIAARLADRGPDHDLVWDSRARVAPAACRTNLCRVEIVIPRGASVSFGLTRLISIVISDLSALGYKPGASFATIPSADGGQITQIFFPFMRAGLNSYGEPAGAAGAAGAP